MATRFYLPSSGSAAASPGFGSLWDDSASAVRRPLVGTPSNSSIVAPSSAYVAEATATSPWDVLIRQYVSDPIGAQTISGTFSFVAKAAETAGTADMFVQLRIAVVSGDGSTERGELYAGNTATTLGGAGASNQEMSTGGTRIYNAVSLSSVDAQAGDRLLVEVGYRSLNTTTTSRSGGVEQGDPTSGTDYALASDTGTGNRPWIEFSGTVSGGGTIVSGGQATETDEGLAGSAVVDDIVAGGQAVETDEALAGTVSEATIVAGGQATETDQALAGAALVDVTVAGGQATETDAALAGAALGGSTVVAGGQAQEADTALAGTVVQPAQTNRNISQARDRGGIGTFVWEPPIVEPPEAPGHDYIAAYHYDSFDAETRTLVGLGYAERVRPRTRILVAGRDVTFWRGTATPEPTYSLISPLLYGSGSITFPQVHAAFERPGEGALHWLTPFAPVVIQRLNEAGAVAGISYRGFLLDMQIRGKELTFGLAGEASGRASLIDRQPRIVRRWNTLGYWWRAWIRELGLPAGPQADTGIALQNAGGMSGTEYTAQLSAQGVGRAGNQWTCMPNMAGEYITARKNTTDIDATVYFDDARTVPDLRRDPAEEPTRVFATATSPSGRRIRGADYPVLQKAKAQPYPMSDGSPFGEGTTDAETDAGSGVTVMIGRLAHTGYLSHANRPGGFDGDVTKAILRLQDVAGLAQTGNMNENTWAALWDVGVTGYNTGGAQIRPMAQSPKVRKYDRTATGAIRGLNPAYDATVIPVDRTIDVGVGFTENEVQEFARQQLHEAADPNWVGTITFHTGGLIEGEHNPGDAAPTSPDIWDARRLKPGMNLWAPLWGEGGTLLHVSGVEVGHDDAGKPLITVSVDTRARDTVEVWEVITRNRESRMRPGRTWMRSHRSSDIHNDQISEWDEVGGQIEDTPLIGGQWNQVGFVGGQEGTVMRLRLRVDDPCEFVACVSGRQLPIARLENRVPAPLTAAGADNWTDQGIQEDLDENWLMLYVAGDDAQPLGYWPKTKGSAGASLTGLWKDDAGFSYFTFDDCSLYLSIFPAQDCTLVGGRIAWNQMGDA